MRVMTPMLDLLAHRPRGAPGCVREATHPYEDEGSTRESRGAVPVGDGAWWSIALSVPAGVDAGDETVRVRLRRHGADGAGDGDVELQLPALEIDAVLTLLHGVVRQARRDAVLPAGRRGPRAGDRPIG